MVILHDSLREHTNKMQDSLSCNRLVSSTLEQECVILVYSMEMSCFQSPPHSRSVFVDPLLAHDWAAGDALREPQRDLALRALDGVAAVDDIPPDFDAEVAADGSRGRVSRVGGADNLPASLDDVFTLPHHCHDWRRDNVLDERSEEGLAREIRIMLLGERLIHLDHLERTESEA